MAWGRFLPRETWPSEIVWAWEKSYGSYGINTWIWWVIHRELADYETFWWRTLVPDEFVRAFAYSPIAN